MIAAESSSSYSMEVAEVGVDIVSADLLPVALTSTNLIVSSTLKLWSGCNPFNIIDWNSRFCG